MLCIFKEEWVESFPDYKGNKWTESAQQINLPRAQYKFDSIFTTMDILVGTWHPFTMYQKKVKVTREVLFEFHLKFWNAASIGIPVRSLL